MNNRETVVNTSEELEKVKKELEIENSVNAEETSDIEENIDTEEIEMCKEFELSTGETIKIDLSNLKGSNIINMKKDYRKLLGKKATYFEDLDDGFYSYVAAVMSKTTFKYITSLPYRDWIKTKNFVRDYLLAW